MAEKKRLSVEEILAAARKKDAGGSEAATPPKSAPAAQPADVQKAAPTEKPAAKPASAEAKTPAKPAAGGRPNVADILAAARKGGGSAAAPSAADKKPAEPKPAESKPAPKPAAAEKKPAEKKPSDAPAKVGGPKDTASILAAARKSTKPGPVSKSEVVAAATAAPAKPAKPAAEKPVAPPMPVRPTYAKKPAETEAAAEETRRGWLSTMSAFLIGTPLAIGFTSLAATGGLWVLGTLRFMYPNVLTEPPSRFKVGFPQDFPPGYVENKFKAQFGIWVVRTEYNGQEQIYALSTVCTHLGCTPNWLDAEQKFKCPCHGSGFYKDGINFEGPAPRPLERYAIRRADDGQLEVDKSRKFQEELGQWSDPTSYFAV